MKILPGKNPFCEYRIYNLLQKQKNKNNHKITDGIKSCSLNVKQKNYRKMGELKMGGQTVYKMCYI